MQYIVSGVWVPSTPLTLGAAGPTVDKRMSVLIRCFVVGKKFFNNILLRLN
jgi:hypothetical protein